MDKVAQYGMTKTSPKYERKWPGYNQNDLSGYLNLWRGYEYPFHCVVLVNAYTILILCPFLIGSLKLRGLKEHKLRLETNFSQQRA